MFAAGGADSVTSTEPSYIPPAGSNTTDFLLLVQAKKEEGEAERESVGARGIL
jgi:hypothetical protein